METKGNLICNSCVHYDQWDGCSLFENGSVPDSVLIDNKHETDLPEQIAPGVYIFDETKTDIIQ